MTQRTDAHTPLRRFWLRSLLVQSLSWLGVLSLLSSNLVLAQTETSIDAVVAPTIQDSKPPAAAAPVEKPAPVTYQSAPAPVRHEQPRLKVSNSPAPAKWERLRQKLAPTSAPVRRERPKQEVSTSPTSQLSRKVRSVIEPTTNSPTSVQARPTRLEKTATNSPTDYDNAYIDSTDYSIGATRGYEPPSKVVLSERSTGCKAVLQQGQGVPGSLCGTAPLRRTRVAVRGTQSINTLRLPRPQAPTWATSPHPQAPSWVRRSRAVAVAGISPVRLGPISVSSRGLSATRRTSSSFQGQIVRNAIPSQQRVVNYQPTLRPPAQPGNANTALLFPLSVPAAITSLFGWRIHPITGNHRFHSGTDLGAPLGTPVLAAYAGNVAIADFLGGYGLTVVLDHNQFTQQTLYGHLSEIFVQPGEWVEQGTVIGRVGSTGNSTGPHLHFETRQLTPEGWVATDPGAQIEYALAQLVQALQTAQASQQPAS